MERVTFDDFIKMYSSRDILFNVRPSDAVMRYLDNIPMVNPQSLPDIPPEERRIVDLIRYHSIHVPYVHNKSVRMEQITDFHGKDRVPTFDDITNIFDSNQISIQGKGIKVAIDVPPLYLILNDYFDNINFNFLDTISLTIKEKENFGDYDGKFVIRIPKVLYDKNLSFFKKYYHDGMALGETTYGLFSPSGIGLKHEHLLFLNGEFMELESFKQLVRTIKLYNNDIYESEMNNGIVQVYTSGNYKKSYLDGILSNNRLLDAEKLLGEYNYGKG